MGRLSPRSGSYLQRIQRAADKVLGSRYSGTVQPGIPAVFSARSTARAMANVCILGGILRCVNRIGAASAALEQVLRTTSSQQGARQVVRRPLSGALLQTTRPGKYRLSTFQVVQNT